MEHEVSRPAPPERVAEAERLAPGLVRTVSPKISFLSPVFPFTETTRTAAEQYKIIRTKVLHHPRKPQLIVVSSGGPGDGKTINSVNLASSFALKRDIRVALIDADMRRPQIANLLGVESSPGLGEVLSGAESFENAAVRLEQFPSLCILPAGSSGNMQSELLDSSTWRALIAKLRRDFDYVIFDAPPIATVADYELVQQVSDGVILIFRPDHSRRNQCFNAVQSVPKEKLIGVILNCVKDSFLWRSQEYAYYAGVQQSA